MMAFVLLIGMAQCKKEQVTPSENNGVNITLKVDGGSEKLNVYPATGAVIFTAGDKIYVGNNRKYVGTLTFENGLFQGTIESEDFSTDDYLHFYFVGNKPTSPTELAAGTTTYTVDISDQTAYLPAISYAPSKEKYSPNTAAYTARLLNKSALVKFAPTLPTNHPITISGLNNEVEIDFANHTLTPTGTTGSITLYSESTTEKWAILLEQTSLSGLTVSASGFEAAIDEETLPSAITNNMYYNTGVGISMTATIPVGSIDGKFTVASGKQVYFSQGNLQYFCSTSAPEWRFAEHQYDYVAFDGSAYSENSNKWIDLFGYGTSGYNNGQTYWQPYSNYNGGGYYSGDLTGNADWGYNAISNGGNETGMWRTLTMTEWTYLFQSRANAGSKWGLGAVNDIHGLVILPDVWTLPDGLNFTPGTGNWQNSYTTEQWNQMESAGAVFLPAAGSRNGTYLGTSNQTNGFYRSSTEGGAYVMFESSRLQLGAAYVQYGDCVRLVCDVD